MAFFFPNSSLPGEEIRWWRLMGGKGIVVAGSDQDADTRKCPKECGLGSAAQSDQAGIIRRREAVVHLLSAQTGVQLVHTCIHTLSYTHACIHTHSYTHSPAALWWSWQEGVVRRRTKQSQEKKNPVVMSFHHF